MTRVLVVEDEESFSDALSFMLRKEGFEVDVAGDGTDAVDEFEQHGADIVLLDLMLPGHVRHRGLPADPRQRSQVPIIMVTAKDSEIDKVVGLELGADDYVTKPYSSRELVARIRAVLRRGGEPEELHRRDRRGRPGADGRRPARRHRPRRDGRAAAQGVRPARAARCATPAGCSPAAQLIDRVWGADYVGDTKTLDVHVKRLRAKIEADPANPRAPGHRARSGLQVRLVAAAVSDPAALRRAATGFVGGFGAMPS